MYYKISFPADYKNIAPLRELAHHIALLEEFDHKVAERVKSVVDELCNNAIEYGSQPTSEVILELYSDEAHMKITCHDQGHGNKLSAADIQSKMNAPVEDDSQRGRGVRMIVKGFVDDLKISDRPEGGITVEAVIKKQ